MVLQQGAGEDDETTPLSGDRPFFTVVMCKTHVQKPYLLIIPTHFQRRLPARRTAVVLRCRGSSWIMSYSGHTKLKNLAAGWADFAIDNRLQVGDGCVFELLSGDARDGGEGEVVLEVQVLRGHLPEPEDLTTKGESADEPMANYHC
ncbi:B3 domain-containing protein Os06g0112300-like [Hordeum vulgare subsp. vulgare]|uniref:TF-B3 domain-containing protein n=1 Tax=Hordeum vulgare subsp. vulgare TaxID=112509 RepID=A0A8I6YY63_HORVV|nr:B3 domain-containing protein Os06g0112300-like [Hordeum vulgare subsp. vulgare]